MAKLSDFFSNFKDREGNKPGHIQPSAFDPTEPVFVPNKKFFNRWVKDIENDYRLLAEETKMIDEDNEHKIKLDKIISNEASDEEIF
jgi:hypothetical protein